MCGGVHVKSCVVARHVHLPHGVWPWMYLHGEEVEEEGGGVVKI